MIPIFLIILQYCFYPYGVFNNHHAHSSIYQPHSAVHQHGTTMEDDKEVVQNARAALDWLDSYA